MKKTFTFFGAMALAFTALFTGCQDPVFYEISKDVKPETATVSGVINSITRYTVQDQEYLVLAADEGIRYKLKDNQTHGSWRTLGALPFSSHSYDFMESTHNGQQIIKVLADATTLYVVTATYADSDDYGTVSPSRIYLWANNSISLGEDGTSWVSKAENWKCVIDDAENYYFPLYYISDYKSSSFAVFQTNNPIRKNRKAYLRSGSIYSISTSFQHPKYYELSIDGPKEITINTVAENTVNPDIRVNASSAVVLGGRTVFFNSMAATTNESYTEPGTRIYYGNGGTLYYSAEEGSINTVKALDVGNAISSIAVCADSILIGRATYSSESTTAYGGVVRTSLTNGVPGTGLIDFETNAEFQLSSSYLINTLLNATPEKTEKESALYSSVSFFGTGTSINVSYNNIGLWSYYPSRGNWNRE